MTDRYWADFAPPEADAGRRNMRLLIQLRWIAVVGQLVTVAVAHWALDVRLPLFQLIAAPLVLGVINILSEPLIRRREAVTNGELTAALLIDVATLAWQLYHAGGLMNPFVSLFLLQVVIGAILLTPASSWAIVVATVVALGILKIHSVPLRLPPQYASDPLALYLQGSLICYGLIAVLLVAFVTRISRNLRIRDEALASARQRAAEEDHIVRMGLLASGAAHELGTPLSLLSVVVGDWRTMPRIADDPDLQGDLADIDNAVQRCKAIVGGILTTAGEARGVAPQVTSVRAFVDGIVADWRTHRTAGTIDFVDRFGKDVTIVSDAALKQVIGNILDNAVDVSPDWVGVTLTREQGAMVLEIADRGPGFAPEMLENFGRPYRSTKGEPGGGLGLFLLVNVVRKLGGEALAFNRPAGGALIRVTLPLAALALDEGTMG
ncbi:MAG: ATP-binding protein [Pseudomonadota bacterium]